MFLLLELSLPYLCGMAISRTHSLPVYEYHWVQKGLWPPTAVIHCKTLLQYHLKQQFGQIENNNK